MNRRRSNAQRKCWDIVGIFLVLLTRKAPEVLATDGPNDYNGPEFFWSSTFDQYQEDPQLNPDGWAEEYLHKHGRPFVHEDPIKDDPKIDIPWQKLEDSRALSEPFRRGPNGTDRESRRNFFRYGLGQRSMELDDESWENSLYDPIDFSDDAFARKPSFWKMTRRLRKSENDSANSTDPLDEETDEDREVRKQCVAKIMELENFLNICKVAKAMYGIVREVKRHSVLMKLLSNFNIDRIGFKKFSYGSVFNKVTRDLRSSNNKMKRAVDSKKRISRRPKKLKKKPPRRKPSTPKNGVESEEETTDIAA